MLPVHRDSTDTTDPGTLRLDIFNICVGSPINVYVYVDIDVDIDIGARCDP